MYKNKFKKFGGEQIPDIIEYLRSFVEKEPNITISVGCDSAQRSRRTTYAITIMVYNRDVRNGAHVVYFRESCPKIKDNSQRLYKEAQYLYDVGTYLDSELSKFYERKDLNDSELKRYKFHLQVCDNLYPLIKPHTEEYIINSIILSDVDKMNFKLVDIHVDFNPIEITNNGKINKRNKSYNAYKSYVPWLRGLGFRTWSKNVAYAATSAADLLLKN
jgi:predicted RNase H-related nuclease YkuK (DUF458 family)